MSESNTAQQTQELVESASELQTLLEYLPWKSGASSEDEIYEGFTKWTTDRGITLWEHQEEAIMDVLAGDHVILSTPTGSGKSLVALALHAAALCTGRISWYTAPIKALVSEKFFELIDILGRDNVGMITGDTSINPDAPVVCCTEEILANAALREGKHLDVGCVAMDEFHFYGDPDRGWAWLVPLLTLPQTQFLLMSATLGDVSGIEQTLRHHSDRAVSLVDQAQRPIPLTYEYQVTPLVDAVSQAVSLGNSPVYVVHFAQDAALETAQMLVNAGLTTKAQRQGIAHELSGVRFSTGFGKILQRLLRNGIGVHHAGMLPRYRLLVEQLAQRGLLPVICGTDTLGVGINVPIHTVILTQLTKFDGYSMRRLKAREFHQIVGRAGRSGFDTEGVVIALAPEYEIENAKALAKAGNDPKKLKKVKRKSAPAGFVGWNEDTFQKLIDKEPESLTPHMQITHAMVLNIVQQGGNARQHVDQLIDESGVSEKQQLKLHQRAQEIFDTLLNTHVIEVEQHDGKEYWRTTIDLPDDFALNQPLSPFLIAALELLDTDSETYALDVISMVEATLEDPRQILRVQERKAKDKAMQEMKDDGIDYDERLERLQDITYPKPLNELLSAAFAQYRHDVPWANDYYISPKSVLRDMVETASDFTGYIARLGIARSEGTLLRYLTDAWRVLDKTVPEEAKNDQLSDIIHWLELIVRGIDSSLVDAWAHAGERVDVEALNTVAPTSSGQVVADRRGLTVLVRNAMFARIELINQDDAQILSTLDSQWGMGLRDWQDALDEFYEAHEYVRVDAHARNPQLCEIDTSEEQSKHIWKVRQIIDDAEGDHDFSIMGIVDLDATQNNATVIFNKYRVGAIEHMFA